MRENKAKAVCSSPLLNMQCKTKNRENGVTMFSLFTNYVCSN